MSDKTTSSSYNTTRRTMMEEDQASKSTLFSVLPLFLVAFSVSVFLFIPLQPASAETFVVNATQSIQDAIDDASPGDTIHITDGEHIQTGTIEITRSGLIIEGDGKGDTIIDTSAVSGYGIHVAANDVVLRDFTDIGPQDSSPSNYGIKIEGFTANVTQTVGISLSDITVEESGRTGIDLNGVNASSFTDITVRNNGGNGFALTDSNDIHIQNIVTESNAWGGIAIMSRALSSPAALTTSPLTAQTVSMKPTRFTLKSTVRTILLMSMSKLQILPTMSCSRAIQTV
jgi:hypothetical protein